MELFGFVIPEKFCRLELGWLRSPWRIPDFAVRFDVAGRFQRFGVRYFLNEFRNAAETSAAMKQEMLCGL